jgi:vacuolar-type H+-ATPase subunit I/STV1
MSKPSPKLVMMRFDPRGGWVKPSDEAVHVEHTGQVEAPAATLPQPDAPAKFSAQSITELGDSIVDVFNSLKLEDPRLQTWEQVNSAIRRMSDKLTEQKLLEERLVSVKAEIAGLRSLASELVDSAYQNEVEVHATSKVRVQVAESLNKKITIALKG